MAKSVYATHNLNIGIGTKLEQDQLNDVSKHIRKMAGEWQDVLDNAIKTGIEEGARSASIKDVLSQFNAQLKAAKLEPLTITVDELEIMDKPIEHAAKLLIQKLGNAFKGGGLGDIISSEITDSLNNLGDTVGKIYKKMEQGAEKSAKNIAKSMHEIEEAAKKVSGSQTKQNKIHNAIGTNISVPGDSKKRKDQFSKLYSTSKTESEDGSSWVEQYSADVKFVRGFRKLTDEQKTEVYGKNLAAVQAYYDKLEAVHEQKMIALNNILAQNDYTKVNKDGKITAQYNFKSDEPWAREKTLQEIKTILSGGLTVKDGPAGGKGGKGGKGGSSNLNNKKPEFKTYTSVRAVENQGNVPRSESVETWGGEYWSAGTEEVMRKMAQSYADNFFKEGAVIKAEIQPINPLVFDAEGLMWNEFDKIPGIKELFPGIIDVMKQPGYIDDDGQKYLNDQARAAGFDSVILENVNDFFDPDQEGDDGELAHVISVLNDNIIKYIGAFDVKKDGGTANISEQLGDIPDFYTLPEDQDIDQKILQLRQQQEAYEQWYNSTVERLGKDSANADLLESLKQQYDVAIANFKHLIEQAGGASQENKGDSGVTPAKTKKTKTKEESFQEQSGQRKASSKTPTSTLSLSEADTSVFSNLNATLANLASALNTDKPDVTAAIDTTELSSVLHDGKPYVVDVQKQSGSTDTDDNKNNKVAIDTSELKSLFEATIFKVQDITEKEPTGSAIDQESINSLVGAIKTGLTPQNDGTKDSGPWAREETLRNITGSTLGKIANKIPKVDTKGLARNDILNRVAQATEAINKKISGRISGNVSGPAAAQQSQLFDAKIQSRVSKLQTKYTKLDASGQLTPEIGSEIMGLWDDLNNVKDQPEFSLWLQQLQQVENKIQQIIELNKLNEQETKASVSAITATHKQYYDAIINAEKAKNAGLQRFWLDESNKSAADLEVLQDEYEAETGARVDLTKKEIEYEKKLGAIKADKAGKAKVAQEKKDAKDHNSAVLELIDSYEELGRMRARRDAMSNSTERTALQQEIRNTSTRLGRKAAKLGQDPAKMKDMADVAQAEEAAAIAARKHKEEYDKLVEKIKERKKLEEKSAGAKENSKFKQDIDDDISKLNDEIGLMQKRIQLTKEEQVAIDELNKKRDDSVRDKKNKKQDQADTKAFREKVKQTRKENNLDIANNKFNAGRRTLDNLWVLDETIDPTIIPEVNELRTALSSLESKYNAVNQAMLNGGDVSDEEILDLNKTSDAVAKKTAALKEMLAHYEKFKNGENIGAYIPGVDEEDQVRSAVNQKFGGKAKIKGFSRDASGLLTANVEVKEGARTFTEYAVAVERADRSIRALKGNTKQLPGFLDGVKRKLGEISQYVSAMSVISRAGQELRRGLQYVRDIDLALTELKKVTDETEKTYEKFLNTASKTAEKVGSTMKDVISSTADWARLGYTMEQATKFAETTQVLMNVSEFTDVSAATDTLISSVQAFDYTAETSMDVVDLLNTIGNNYAISTADLARSLTKSSASLVAAGGDLAEAAALTATANAIVQDADSVGTALKTTSLRLRGTDAKVLEEEGVDSEGAVTSKSKLQSKVKALSGVDILTQSGEYKSTYQILSQIADVWEDINNMDQAALLEILAGKRNASTLAAILQAPEQLKAAYEDARNAEGSALEENLKYMDSIQGRIDQFNNAVQTIWANVLDDDAIKVVVKIGTELIKILDALGPIKTLFAGIAVYIMRKNGIAGFGDIFKKSVISIDEMREKLEKLKQEYDKLDGTKSQKNLRKQDKLGSQIKEIEAEIKAYDNLTAKRDEAFKKRDAAQAKLKEAQDELTNAWAQGETGNVDSDDIEKLSQRVDAAKVEFEKADIEAQEFDKTVKKTGKTGNATFQGLSASVKNFTKELLKSLGQMLVMMAVMKIFEVVGGWIDDAITTAEEAAEAFEELTSKLEETKQAIQDIEGELEAINDKIAEINSQESLSFADEEEIARLKEEREILERNLELNEELAKQKQQQVNNQVSDQVEYYKNKGIDSGKTRDEKTMSGLSTGALVGGGVALATGVASAAGSAILGAKAGAALGTFAGPIGTAIGLAAGAVIGAAVGAAIGDASGYFEEKVGESIENMDANLDEKEEELKKARKKYQETGKDGDREKYEEAQKALSNYRGEMAKYFTDMDAMYKNVDLKTIEDPDEYAHLKKEMEDFYNERDKWLIKSGAEGARESAIERIFDKEELNEASSNIDALLQKLKENPGDKTILALIASQVGLAKEDLEAVGVSVDEAMAHFTQFSSGIDMSPMVDPMKTAMSAIDTYASKMETLASIQSEVADGFIISAEKAREFAAVYPEILQSAKATADGQIQLNSGVVNALISGERSEADAAMETDKQKIEGTIATLEAKKSYLEAQLEIMEAEAEGNRQLAINQVELMQERYNQAVDANIGEAEAYKLAMENMGLNATEFNKVVADVANDTSSNMSGAASQMSKDLYDGYSAGADSANAFGRTAANAINALKNPFWKELPFGGKTIGGSGGFKSNVTNGNFTGLQIDKKILDVKFDNLKLNLTNQLSSVNEAIANAYGALALMDTNIQAPLSSFDPDKDSGGKDDAPTKFEKMQAAYEAALANLEHRQKLIQGQIDILEAQHKGVSSKYYNELIKGENDKINLYEGQLELFRALLKVTPETNEEYNEIVEIIQELELNIQEATLAAIEFGEAMNDNWLKGIQDIGDAYENLYNINDRQKGSMELYKEGVEIGGGQVNERWYDDMIAKAGEAGNLARQNLQDSLWAIDLWRNADNPFEAGTDEYEAFEYDRNTKLQEAWAQAADAKDKIQETDNEALQLAEDKKDAYIEAWDNIATAFERIGGLFEDQISLIDGYEARLEVLNINVPDEVYKKKIAAQNNFIGNLDEQIAYDEKLLAEYAAKYGTNDERYLTKWEELNDKRVQRYEAETEIIQIEQQIIDNQIDRFNQTIDRMNNAVDKMNNIKGLISDEDVADENGDWTAEGLTQAGLGFQEMAYQKEMISAYTEEMEELTELYEQGKISEKEYYEHMKELEDGQWSAIEAYKSAEDAIIELEEARIDALENGLQEEIDAYAELIELKKEELNAERDLFEFRRDVEDQSKNISEIERRIASLSGSSSNEDRAEMKRLQKELYDANRGLDDTYRNHSYDQTSQALDDELEAYEKNYEKYIEGLRDELKNTDELIKQIYGDVVTNGQLVFETLVQLSDEHGFILDNNLTRPWKNANGESLRLEEDATRHYSNITRTVELGTAGFVDNIEKPWKRGQEESKLFAQDAETHLQAALQSAQNKQQSMTDATAAPWTNMRSLIQQSPSWVSKAAEEILTRVKANVVAINAEYAKITMPSVQKTNVAPTNGSNNGANNGVKTQTPPQVPPKTPPKSDPKIGRFKSSQVLGLGRGPLSADSVEKLIKSGDVIYNSSTGALRNATAQEKAKNKLKNPLGFTMFAKGSTSTKKDQLAVTDESWIGEEITLAAGKNGQLQYLKKGSAVLPADISANLIEWGKMNPSMMNSNVIKAVVPNIETNAQAVSVNFDALVKADNITNDVLPEVEKLVEKQLNNFTRNLNYSLKRVGGR